MLPVLLRPAAAVPQVAIQSASVSRLFEAPRQFDKKLVRVQGFLAVETQPRHSPVFFLYARGRNQGDSILVIANREMVKGKEQIDGKEVSLTGVFHAVPTGDHPVPVLKDISEWSVVER